MAANTEPVLVDPHPCRHIVYPYTDEEKAVNAVFLFAGSGLSKGESVVLIMSDAHFEPITGRLAAAGHDVLALQASGRLECLRAERMLCEIMPHGKVNSVLFKEGARRLISRARGNSLSRKVRIFGEMVSLLLASDNVEAAEELESLWNEIIDSHDVSLFCTYTLPYSRYASLPQTLVKLHSHDISPQGACAND